MPRMLEYLEYEEAGSERSYRCVKCGESLGAGADYRALAGSFDDSINAYEPAAVNTHADTFVLRHHCCPHCAVLFEVEMVPRVAD
jgi:acetone carboxylase gamma subunit